MVEAGRAVFPRKFRCPRETIIFGHRTHFSYAQIRPGFPQGVETLAVILLGARLEPGIVLNPFQVDLPRLLKSDLPVTCSDKFSLGLDDIWQLELRRRVNFRS